MSKILTDIADKIPAVGYGTANMNSDNESQIKVIMEAMDKGVRLFDTAHAYGSEESLGEALHHRISSGDIKREELFVQTKYEQGENYGYHDCLNQFEESLNKLQLDYVDAYLIHQPVPRYCEESYEEQNRDTWKAFEELFKKGRVRAIGVCNFLERHILSISDCDDIEISPMINQIEVHPLFQEMGLVKWCKNRGILIEGWGTLAGGRIFDNKVLKDIANKHNRTIAQVCIQFSKQINIIPLIKCSKPERIQENFLFENFWLDDEDIKQLKGINTCTEHWPYYLYNRQQMY